MNVKIITDSACDLPDHITQEYNIDVIPLIVFKNEKEYLDGVNIRPKELYDYMREGGVAKTAQATYESIEQLFSDYAKSGTPVIYIAFSSELSGTYQTATLVASDIKEEYPDSDITVIDSKAASLGFGLIVYQIAKLAKEGVDKEALVEKTLFLKEHMKAIFTVENLEYLYRGGRLSKTAAIVGSVLNIKPILHVAEGKLIPIDKVRGRKKSLNRMIEMIGEQSDDSLKNQLVAISHGDDLKTAEWAKEKIAETYGVKDFIIRDIGCAIGAHSGPGTLALFFVDVDPN